MAAYVYGFAVSLLLIALFPRGSRAMASCPPLPSPIGSEGYATYITEGTAFVGATANLSCSPGFRLYTGNLVRTCVPQGGVSWNGTAPVCTPDNFRNSLIAQTNFDFSTLPQFYNQSTWVVVRLGNQGTGLSTTCNNLTVGSNQNCTSMISNTSLTVQLGDFTIPMYGGSTKAFWINVDTSSAPSEFSNNLGTITYSDGANPICYLSLGMNETNKNPILRLNWRNTDSTVVTTSCQIAQSMWTHVSFSTDSGTCEAKLYVNGIQCNESVTPTSQSSACTEHAAVVFNANVNQQPSPTLQVPVLLADFRLYRAPLNATEMAMVFNESATAVGWVPVTPAPTAAPTTAPPTAAPTAEPTGESSSDSDYMYGIGVRS